MESKKVIAVAVVALLAVFMAKNARADIYCEREVVTTYNYATPQASMKTTHQRLYQKDNMLRLEEVESGVITLIRLDKQLIFRLDPTDNTYTEMDFNTVQMQLSQAEMSARKRQPQVENAQDSVKKKMIDAMPAEQRSFASQIMSAQMNKMRSSMTGQTGTNTSSGIAEVKLTSDTKTILGHTAKRIKIVQVTQGKLKKVLEVWVNTELTPGNYLTDFIGKFGMFNTDVLTQLKKIEGLPLELKYRVQLGEQSGNLKGITVTKLEQKEIPFESFEVPASFKKLDIPSAAAQPEGKTDQTQSEESF